MAIDFVSCMQEAKKKEEEEKAKAEAEVRVCLSVYCVFVMLLVVCMCGCGTVSDDSFCCSVVLVLLSGQSQGRRGLFFSSLHSSLLTLFLGGSGAGGEEEGRGRGSCQEGSRGGRS